MKNKSDEVLVNQKEYLAFLEIYHHLRPYLGKEITVKKADLLKKYPKRKEMIEEIWVCVFDLKLIWPHEMIGRVLNS